MSVQARSKPEDAEALRRRIGHDLYQKLAFASFVIWTGGCLLLFITFAAGNPRPVFPAMMSMTTPLVPAVLIWIAYRPLLNHRVARELRGAESGTPTGSSAQGQLS
jgi:hypothetical protein